MPLPWEEYRSQDKKPWEDFKSDGTAEADARAKVGIERAKAAGGANPDAVANIPEYSPRNYGQAGSTAMGAADATTFGYGDELASYLGSAVSGLPRNQVLSEMRGDAKKAQSDNPGSYLAGQIGGGLAQAAATGGGGAATALARGGAGLGKIAAGSALDGLLYGGAYGSGSADNGNRIAGGATGAGIGAGLGLAAPILAAGGSALARKVVSPFASSPEREAAVSLLSKEGVPVTAGQRTGSNALRYAESELGGSKAAGMMDRQAEAFTDAAMRKAGGSGRATPDNLAALKGNLGQAFEDISNRNSMVADQQLANDVGQTFQRYNKLLETQQKPIIKDILGDLVTRVNANGGKLSGPEYQSIRSDLSRAASSTTNQTLAGAFRGIRNALDGAMERSIDPADLGAWKVLRKQYGNYKVVNRASSGGGEAAGLGLISPAQLRVAASTGNREGFANGASEFTDLAKAGQAVMTPLPNSGTAARSAVRNLGVPIGSAGVGSMIAGIPGAIAGAAAPYVAGRTLMSPMAQRYLGNQAAAGPANKVSEALLAALLRSGGIQGLLGSR
ncbi:hypothetical protein FJ973_29625 [Mesorhizobium sp. B2-1-3]|uniref:hypothetical protein n=1 Tax=Mesorhizobium sp. B2-1-3 TaxID=2589972 RepID=UPI00112C966D|nr:hypothetical protein [Mesorhizobium sp. B2-1-3]TPN03805.1 hypothetical protein FJ973_29625 [Mesorhizobium sp. B2-1-3]